MISASFSRLVIVTFALALSIVTGHLLTVTAAATTAASHIIYVNQAAGGANNGASWPDAYTNLQTALATATSGDEIWVAAGVYKPIIPADPNNVTPAERQATFQLQNGVAIYGGFAGTETAREDRDWTANPTILSGDINNSGNLTDNSYHVVTGSGTDTTAILDGFTITAGQANSSIPDNRGGGLYNGAGSPTLTNVTFSGNNANDFGGGMYNQNSNPTLTNVSFSDNSASQNGGGMYNTGSSPTLTNVSFSGNSSVSAGGGMRNTSNSNPTLVNVVFSSNQVSNGNGGGMANNSGSSPTLTNVTFSGNSASQNGGGMHNTGSSPTLTNVTFGGNSASQNGGGMFNGNSSSPTLTNVIIANSVSSGDCVNDGTSTLSAISSHNLIEDSANACGLTDGENGNLIGVDARLGPLDDNGGATLTHLPFFDSPAIDYGGATCPATDQRGETRGDYTCDIGAVEVQLSDTSTISKSVVAGSAYTFGPTLAKVEVVDDGGGCLTSISIQRTNSDHPQAVAEAHANLQTGVYWGITGIGCSSGFTATLTLPTPNFVPDASDKLCRYTAGMWDCGLDSQNSPITTTMSNGLVINALARTGVNGFSDWAAGNNVGPTAVTLQSITAIPSSSPALIFSLPALLLLAAGGLALRRRYMA